MVFASIELARRIEAAEAGLGFEGVPAGAGLERVEAEFGKRGAGVRAGCEIAVVTTLPGSRSQENVQKHGFELLYARAILRRSA